MRKVLKLLICITLQGNIYFCDTKALALLRTKIKNIISYLVPITIERRRGELSKLEVTIENGRCVLNTPHYNYSFGGLHKVFEKAFETINISEREIKNVLLLGFGAGSVAELLVEKHQKNCEITGIERDAVVLELAQKYFKIDRFQKLSVKHDDAYLFVQSCKDEYDMIIVDVFVGSKTPPHVEEEKFLKHLERLLTERGMVLYNRAFFDESTKRNTILLAEKMNKIIGKTTLHKIRAYSVRNAMLVCEK